MWCYRLNVSLYIYANDSLFAVMATILIAKKAKNVKLKLQKNRENTSPDGFKNDKLATMWNGNTKLMFVASHAGGENSREWASNFPKKCMLVYTKIQFWVAQHYIIVKWKRKEWKNEAFKKFKPENMHMAAHTWKERHISVIKLKGEITIINHFFSRLTHSFVLCVYGAIVSFILFWYENRKKKTATRN